MYVSFGFCCRSTKQFASFLQWCKEQNIAMWPRSAKTNMIVNFPSILPNIKPLRNGYHKSQMSAKLISIYIEQGRCTNYNEIDISYRNSIGKEIKLKFHLYQGHFSKFSSY